MAQETTTEGPPPANGIEAPISDSAPTEASPRPRGRIIKRDRSNPPPQALPEPPRSASAAAPRARGRLPASGPLSAAQTLLVRVVAVAGIIGISAAIAAIMASSNAQGWLIGVVISAVSVTLTAVLWSWRRADAGRPR